MTTAAELVVKVSADTSDAEGALRQFAARLSGGSFFGSAAASGAGFLGAQLIGGAVRGVQQLGTAVVGLGVSSVRAGADFSASMDAITAVLGGTSAEAKQLGDFILELGMNPMLKVSVDEAAAAVEVLATQGATADTIMGGLAEQTILLANSTGGQLTDAANVTSDAINLFGLSADDAATIVNGATGVINQSKFDINDYAYALANGGATAAQFGVNLDDFNTVIAGTSNSFVRGQTAGTAFSTMLTRLVPASGPAAKAMAELGLIAEDGSNIFFDATGNLKEMNEIVGILADSFGGLTDEQRINYAAQIFGTQGMDTALALSRLTREEYDALKATIADTNAFDSAKVRTDNLKSSWETLSDTMTAAKISFGAALEEPLQNVVRTVQPVIEMASPIIEWAGATLADLLAGWAEPIIQQVNVGLQTYVYLTDTMGMAPLEAAKAALQAALGTDKITLGPVNIGIQTGAITWGDQGAETFAGYAVGALRDSFVKQLSSGYLPGGKSGAPVGAAFREWVMAEADKLDFGDAPIMNKTVGVLGAHLNRAFQQAMVAIDAKGAWDALAANMSGGAAAFGKFVIDVTAQITKVIPFAGQAIVDYSARIVNFVWSAFPAIQEFGAIVTAWLWSAGSATYDFVANIAGFIWQTGTTQTFTAVINSFNWAASRVIDFVANITGWGGTPPPFSGGGGGGGGGGGAGAGGAEATGNVSVPGGLTLVGERGPELVRLPWGARVWNAAETSDMMQPAPVVINATVLNALDIETLARRIERIQRRR